MKSRVCVAKRNEIPLSSGREFVVEGKIIAIFHIDGEYYAIDGMCPHAGGPLGTGTVRGKIVTCPWHGWQFDVTTGKHCLTDKIRCSQYSLEVQGEELWIEI